MGRGILDYTMLATKIQQDQLDALKSKNEVRLNTLRLLSAELKNKHIDIGRELTDEDVVGVIRKQVKQLIDAKELFAKGGRTDLVAENEEQIAVLSGYLHTELSDEELRIEMKRVIEENKELAEKNPNALFGIAVKELREKADPSRITRILKEELQR